MPHTTISSPDNARVKLARALLDRKRVRYRERQYLVEGVRLVRHGLERGWKPAFLFAEPELMGRPDGPALLARAEAMAVEILDVPRTILQHVTDTVRPQGVAAVFDMLEVSPATVSEASLVLVLDTLQDPGNLGTLLRTALAAGVEAVVLSRGCADLYAPKTVRGTMGALFDLPVLTNQSWEHIAPLLQDKQVLLSAADGEQLSWEVDWQRPTALIVGSEAHGASAQAHTLATSTVRLPMAEAAESLNAAVAAGVLLFEARRQHWARQQQ